MYANAARAAGEIIMTDPAVYLEKIAAFSRMLRLEGLIVSPMETADACHVLITLGFEDRELVKTALRTVYAKSREEQLTFDRVFDGFFVSEETMRQQAEAQMQRAARIIANDCKGAVLIKGGHLSDSSDDLLYADGRMH